MCDNGMETLDKHWDWEGFKLSALKYVRGKEGEGVRNCESRDETESFDPFYWGIAPNQNPQESENQAMPQIGAAD